MRAEIPLGTYSYSISVTVTEPKIKILQVGESVTLRCNVQTGGQVSTF